MNIIYASDDNFAMVAGVSIYSLLKNNNSNINIFYLYSNLSDSNKKRIEDITHKFDNCVITFIDVDEKLKAIVQNHLDLHGSYLTYARLFISELIPENAEKVLYLDCDTIVSGDISNLYNSVMPKCVGMCIDIVSEKYKNKLGLGENDLYFNAGVCLIDLKKFRLENLHKKVVEALNNHVEIRFHDQDILNYALKDNIFPISPSFNFFCQYYYFDNYKNILRGNGLSPMSFYNPEIYCSAAKQKIIYHFTTNPVIVRPWFSNSNHPEKKTFLDIKSKTPFSSFELKKNKQPWKQKILSAVFNYFPKTFSSWLITQLHVIFFS